MPNNRVHLNVKDFDDLVALAKSIISLNDQGYEVVLDYPTGILPSPLIPNVPWDKGVLPTTLPSTLINAAGEYSDGRVDRPVSAHV